MKPTAPNRKKNGTPTIPSVLVLILILITLTGCSQTSGIKSSGVVHSREATDIWHSYEVLPNYNYYISGAESRPWYIVGIDDRYSLTSKNWKPVDLTPEMLNKWINYYRPRVGYDLKVYGSFIVDPNGERVKQSDCLDKAGQKLGLLGCQGSNG
jgi:hypothetical protein